MIERLRFNMYWGLGNMTAILQVTFPMYFLREILNYGYNFTEMYFDGFIDKCISTDSGSSLVPKRQTVTWSIGDQDYWCHVASRGHINIEA